MRISDWSSDVCSSDLIDLDLGWAITSDLTLDASMNLLDSKYGKYLTIGQLLNSIATGDPAAPGARSIGYDASGKWLLRASDRLEEHTSELQSLMRISYAVFRLKKKKKTNTKTRRKRDN